MGVQISCVVTFGNFSYPHSIEHFLGITTLDRYRDGLVYVHVYI